MGVDWRSCNRCGETFPDCGDFVRCDWNCDKEWCGDECAKAEGFIRNNCRLGLEIDQEGCLEDDREKCVKACNSDEKYIDCEGCPNYTLKSCSYCRGEDYEDYELLDRAMELLDCDREYLIRMMKKIGECFVNKAN